MHSFDGSSEYLPINDTVAISDGFGAYDDVRYRYSVKVNEFQKYKLKPLDRKIIEFLVRCPFVTTKTLTDCVGEDSYERIKYLFDNGYVGKFNAKDLSRITGVLENGDTNYFTQTVFFPTKAACDALGIKDSKMGIRSYNADNMAVPVILEISVLSTWCAYALKFQPARDVKFISFSEGDRRNTYMELVLEKRAGASFFRKGIKCRFHVLSAPKHEKGVPEFLGKLYHFDALMKKEEKDISDDVHSYVVIVCDTLQAMEHLAVEIEHMVYKYSGNPLLEDHYLYSLETDGKIDLGAFKFMHKITFPGMSIIHDQVAFK